MNIFNLNSAYTVLIWNKQTMDLEFLMYYYYYYSIIRSVEEEHNLKRIKERNQKLFYQYNCDPCIII